MNRLTCLFSAAALLLSGFPEIVIAQENSRGERRGEGRRWSEEQRQEFLQLSPEERQERVRQWRENRPNRGDQAESPGIQAETPPGPPPEKYIDQLEFRSVLTLDGATQFSLHNPYDQRTFWVSDDRSRNGVEVVAYKSDENLLEIRHDGETRTLALSTSRVGEFQEATAGSRPGRREEWEARREQMRELHEKWRAAVAGSPELQELDGQFRDLGGDFRQLMQSMREVERGSPEHEQLREKAQEYREEFQLLTQYAVLQLRDDPNFTAPDLENMERVVRMMAFHGGRGGPGGESRRGAGGGPPGRGAN